MPRRAVLAAAAAALAGVPAAARAQTTTLAAPQAASLAARTRVLVPGPDDTALANWAGRVIASLGRSLTPAVSLSAEILGGGDGITAANRFVAEAAPDGRTLLMLTGTAMTLRLAGETRARFDPAGWLPVCAARRMVVLFGHGGALPYPAAGRNTAPLRLGYTAPDDAAQAMHFALDILGLPVGAMTSIAPQEQMAAFAQGRIDALVTTMHSPTVVGPTRAGFQPMGVSPWLALSPGHGVRDPLLADVPVPEELRGRAANSPAVSACTAVGAAAQLGAALVLPALTSADTVALWRRAADRWVDEESHAAEPSLPIDGVTAAHWLQAMTPAPDALLAYREWLLKHKPHRPG